MEDRPQQIIIKKVKKVKGGGSHGGSWKVAYADFVTAMMAFFLLLWLLSMVSDERRAALSEYFRRYSIFQQSGMSAVDMKDSQKTDPRFPNEASGEAQQTFAGRTKGKSVGEFRYKKSGTKSVSDEELAKKIRTSIDDKIAQYRDQVLVDVIDGGIRIQIIDAEGAMMFALGSAQPTERAKEILNLVAQNVNEIQGKIVIEGHTDAAPFRGGQITNWELSTARASAARRILEENGIDTTRIARVVGYADQELLLPLNPRDQRNRRISIIVLHPDSS